MILLSLGARVGVDDLVVLIHELPRHGVRGEGEGDEAPLHGEVSGHHPALCIQARRGLLLIRVPAADTGAGALAWGSKLSGGGGTFNGSCIFFSSTRNLYKVQHEALTQKPLAMLYMAAPNSPVYQIMDLAMV
jgi:hypothetical protein